MINQLVFPKSLHSYNPIPGRCGLYLPFWAQGLSGPLFQSVESYGHEVTNVGALWKGNLGRFFDATDDIITVPAHAGVDNLFAGGGTAAAWINLASDGENSAGRIFDKDSDTKGWQFLCNAEAVGVMKIEFVIRFTGGGTFLLWDTNNTVVPINAVVFIAVTFNSSTHTNTPIVYVNESTPALTKSGTGTGTNKDDSAEPLTIGNKVDTTVTADGYIMEAWNWEYILSAAELSYVYRQTRGRHA